MTTMNPTYTGQISSESLLTNVQEGKGRFLFKEKPEIKNICGLFGTAGKPNIKRNQKIEPSDFNEGFTRYYGVNLQASSGGQRELFTNISVDGKISRSTTGHYMSPKTKNQRISLRPVDYDLNGQPVKELFQQLIRDIDQKNTNNADFADDFTKTVKILGGKEVNMKNEDVFGILFVHDGASEDKKVTGRGIIYHIYRHINFRDSVLKKVESYFEVTDNTLTIDSDAVTLQVANAFAKLIDANIETIKKGPIMREEIAGTEVPDLLNTPNSISERRSNSSSQVTRSPSVDLLQLETAPTIAAAPRTSGTEPFALTSDPNLFEESNESTPSARPPIGTVQGRGSSSWRLDEADRFETTPTVTVQGREADWRDNALDPFAPSARSSARSSASSMDTTGRELNRMEKENKLPLNINVDVMTEEDVEKMNENLKYFVYRKDLVGQSYRRDKIPENEIKFVQSGDKRVRKFFKKLDESVEELKNKGTVNQENKENAAANIVMRQIEEVKQIMKATGGGRSEFQYVEEDLESLEQEIEDNGVSVVQASEVSEALDEVLDEVASFDDNTVDSQGTTITPEEEKRLTAKFRRMIQGAYGKLRKDTELDSKVSSEVKRMSGDSNMSGLTEYTTRGVRPQDIVDQEEIMNDNTGSMQSFSTENDSLRTDDFIHTPSYNTANTSPSEGEQSRGGKRKTRRRSSKKNRKSKKVGGKKTKPKGKTKGKKIPFKKLLKKTRAKK